VSIVIVGGGIAGLSAAWRLQKLGLTDLALLEMDPEAGGNARSDANDGVGVSVGRALRAGAGPACDARARAVLGAGRPRGDGTWQERSLCQAPQERLFLPWPLAGGPRAANRAHLSRSRSDGAVRGAHRRAPRIGRVHDPHALGVKPALPFDRMSMAEWLSREGLDSPWLRWSVDYACRDDYGALSASTSAWAGIHYFAAREKDDPGPLTWPRATAGSARRLLERVGRFVHTDSLVYRIAKAGTKWRVLTPAIAWTADAVIFAAPSFLGSRLIENGPPTPDFEYSPVGHGQPDA
jgi:glycine/D-amino acid oxidase-like deaminating enzyme